MPQLGSGGGDDLGATDEMLAFKDEGEQEEKIPENAFTERDLADLKSSLVNESEGSGSPAAAAADPEVSRAAPAAPAPGPRPPPRHPPLCLSLSSPCRPSGVCRIRREFIRRSSRTTWMMVSGTDHPVSVCVCPHPWSLLASSARPVQVLGITGVSEPLGPQACCPAAPGSEGCRPGCHSPAGKAAAVSIEVSWCTPRGPWHPPNTLSEEYGAKRLPKCAVTSSGALNRQGSHLS